jgi:hypothetical protein
VPAASTGATGWQRSCTSAGQRVRERRVPLKAVAPVRIRSGLPSWCLTPAQIGAVRAFYRGLTDPAGRSLYNGGQPYGSELGWQGAFIAPARDTGAPADTYSARVALSYLKYLAYVQDHRMALRIQVVRR